MKTIIQKSFANAQTLMSHAVAGALIALALLIQPTHTKAEEGAMQLRDIIDVSLRGRVAMGLYFMDHDDGRNAANEVIEYRNADVKALSTKVFFNGSHTNDRGITMGADLEYRLDTDGVGAFGETYIYFEGNFGKMELGRTHGATENMHIGVPAYVPFDFIDFANAANIGRFSTSDGTYITAGGDDYKLSFYTPRLFGLKMGFSFLPTRSSATGENSSEVSVKAPGTLDRMFFLAASYNRDLPYGMGLTSSLGYAIGNSPKNGGINYDDAQYYSAAAALSWMDLSFGLAYKNTDALGQKDEVFSAALAYAFGPYIIGTGYRYSITDPADSLSDDVNWAASVGGTYWLSDKLRVGVDLQYIVDKNRSPTGDQDRRPELDSVSVGFITGLSF